MADKKISALTAASTPLAGTEVLPIVQSGATVKVAVSNLTAGRDIAATSLTTAAVQATNSGGLTLKNSSGTAQLSVGAGGGDNITLSVATNITPANAAVAISPTGTGTVTLNPATASTINNMSIGATTASTGRFTSVTATTGNFVVGTSGQGVDFSATPGTGTSELLNDYEEGTWTPSVGGDATYYAQGGNYTRVGNKVYVSGTIVTNVLGTGSAVTISGLPFAATNEPAGFIGFSNFSGLALTVTYIAGYATSGSVINLRSTLIANTAVAANNIIGGGTRLDFAGTYLV
jgi:hypothetical protein